VSSGHDTGDGRPAEGRVPAGAPAPTGARAARTVAPSGGPPRRPAPGETEVGPVAGSRHRLLRLPAGSDWQEVGPAVSPDYVPLPRPRMARPADTPVRRGPRWWRWLRRIVEIAMVGGGVWALWHERGEVGAAARLLQHPRWGWLVVAIVAEVASMVAFARLQRWLLRAGGVNLGLWPMTEITLAGNSLAVSLPGGAAWSAGFAFEQLRRRGASKVLSVWVLLVAGALSSFALFVLMVVGVEWAGDHGPARDFRLTAAALAAIPVVAGLLAVLSWRVPAVRRAVAGVGHLAVTHLPGGRRAGDVLGDLWRKITLVQPRPIDWIGTFGLAFLNWAEDCACLVASMIALRSHVPWPGILVAYGIAQVGASLPITPGGLGIVEASLSYALIAYGVPAPQAVAGVLLYRAISFWGFVPIGWLAWGFLRLVERRGGGADHPHPWAWHHAGAKSASPDPERHPARAG